MPRLNLRDSRILYGIAGHLALVIASAIAVWILSADARRQVDALAVASSDNAQWSLAQAEVEFLTLMNAARALQAGQGTPDEVRRRYDIFYSRMQTVRVAPSFATIRAQEDAAPALDRIYQFIDRALPTIDADDAGLRAGLPALIDAGTRLQPELRTVSLASVTVFAAKTKAQRARVSGALRDLGLISFGLLSLLLATVALLFRMNREEQRQSAQISQTQKRLQAIIATSIDAILVTDRNGIIQDYNGAAARVFEYSRDEAVGTAMIDLLVPERLRDQHRTDIRRYRDEGRAASGGAGLLRTVARRKTGAEFPVEVSVNIADSDQEEVFVWFARDISRRVENETALRDARDKAVAGEKAKADLLAVMSHEMRTPLNGVLGTLELLSQTDLDAQQSRYLATIDLSGRRLLDQVNTVLDISRVDAGKAQVAEDVFDLAATTSEVADSLRHYAGQRGNALSVQVDDAAQGAVRGDAQKLQQVLINLIGNAIKFTENGEVSVHVARVPGSDQVTLQVSDTGIGIDTSDHDRIFEDFVTLDTSYGRAAEGTGLGLGLVRRMVAVMGGTLALDSTPGAGSRFTVMVPLPQAEMPRQNAPLEDRDTGTSKTPKSQPRSARVLVVEDNDINRMVVREMLTAHVSTVVEAVDGQDGVTKASEAAFDLILMDISMPRLDGATATRMIRGTPGPNQHTPIVALTAHVQPEDVKRFHEAGMVQVLTKPVSSDALARMLAEVLPDSPAASPAYPEQTAANPVAPPQPAPDHLRAGVQKLRRLYEAGADTSDIVRMAQKLATAARQAGAGALEQDLTGLVAGADAQSRTELGDALERLDRLAAGQAAGG